MRHSINSLMLGLFCTALFTSAISVYILHDVDQGKTGHLKEAFAGLCIESLLFAAVLGGAVGLFTLLGLHLFHLKAYSPRVTSGLILGIGTAGLQYPWDFAARKAFPGSGNFSLALYMVVAIALCTVVLIRDAFNHKKRVQAVIEPS